MNKNIVIGAIVAVLIIGGVGAFFLMRDAEEARNSDTVVATVNGTEITQGELETRITEVGGYPEGSDTDENARTEFEKLVVEQIINETLIRTSIESGGFIATEDEIDAEMRTIRDRFETEEAYNTELAASGLDAASLRVQVAQQLVLLQYYASLAEEYDTEATAEEIQNVYDTQVAGQEDAPELSEIEDQIRVQIEQQKIQSAIASEATRLRTEADVEILI